MKECGECTEWISNSDVDWEILPFVADIPLANPKRVFADVDVIISTINAIGGRDPVRRRCVGAQREAPLSLRAPGPDEIVRRPGFGPS